MTTFCCALALARCAVALAPAAEAPDYDRQVRPILAKYCFGCHTPEEAKGDLVMTDFAKFKAGGKRGLAFVAGKASESPMIRMVEGTAKPRMPPKGNPAPGAAEVAVLRAWIDGGAKGPVAVAAAGLKYPIIAPKKSVSPSVTSIAFAPDGKTFAYAKHRTAVLVETDSGSIVREFGPNGGAVTALRFLEGGKLLLVAAGTAGHAGETRIWEVATGKQLHAIRGHADAIYGLAATVKGTRFASAGYDRVIRVWNAPDAPGPALKGHNDAVYALAFSPDGNRLASASGDRTIKLWDVVKGERLDTFSQPLQDQYAVAFRPDGRQVAAAGGDNRIRVWSIGPTGAEGTNKLLHARYAHESPIVQLVYSPDGSLLASSAQDNTVRVWRASDVTETALLEKQPDWPTALAFFPDNKRLLVGRFDGTLATYDVTTKAKLANIEPKKKPPAAPVVESILPGGIERGKPARLRVRGKNLGAEGTKVEIAGGSAKITGTAPGGALLVSATVPPTAARGPVELKVTTPGGSSAKSVLVDDIPQVEETKDNDGAPAQPAATPRSLPIAIWGTLEKKGDVDYHAFAAKKGETVVAELAGRSLRSKIKGSISVVDASGKTLAHDTAANEGDPLTAFTAPADGAYLIRVEDAELGGAPGVRYRLAIGAFPMATGVYPLGVPAGKTTEVEVLGYNLGGEKAPKRVPVKAEAAGMAKVPLDDPRYAFRFRQVPSVVVGDAGEGAESEPNDAAASANRMVAPGVLDGRIEKTGDVDCFRFAAKAGETWIVETEGERRGSPVDTRVEILDAAGKPIERLLLQAVRDAAIHFRNIDSRQLEIRTTNWTEMELNQLLYMSGEVGKFFRLPEGPDSGFLFYSRAGVRLAYFDSTPTAHALNDPVYIVEPHPPGTKLTPNGLPSFPVHYGNDDSSDRKIGRDSRATFVAPATGEYVLRVTDSHGAGAPDHAYRLLVRRPQPNFEASILGANPMVGSGSGREIGVTIERTDGFDGEVKITAANVPPGFTLSAPTTVEADHLEAKLSLVAAPDAKEPPAGAPPIVLTATAIIGGKAVTKKIGDLGKVTLAARPKFTVRLEPANVVVAPGSTTTAWLVLERHDFKDRLQFQVRNLPHGVYVDNLGLNGILIPPGQTKRQVFITARPWVQETTRPFFAVADQASPAITVTVRRPQAIAEKE